MDGVDRLVSNFLGEAANKSLKEQAFKRKEAMERLENLADTITMHLFKYFLMPNHESANHWRKELEGWRGEVVRLSGGKSGKANFSRANLYKVLWGNPFSDDNDLARRLNQLRKAKYATPSGIDVESDEFREAFMEFVISYLESILDPDKSPNY